MLESEKKSSPIGSLMAAGGIGAILVGAWSHIKSFFGFLISIFIETYDLHEVSHSAIRYFKSQSKLSYSWDKAVHSERLYLKTYKSRKLCYFATDRKYLFFSFKFGGIVYINESNLTALRFAKIFDKFGKEIFSDILNLQYESDRNNFTIRNIVGNSKRNQHNSDADGSKMSEVSEIPAARASDRDILLNIKAGILNPIYFTVDDFLLESIKDNDPFDDYYLSDDLKMVVDESYKWVTHENWFKERGASWKRGFCLYGSPGCGKSSFVVRLAKKLKIPLYVYNLSTLSNQEVIDNWNGMQKPCIVLFEDFDSVFDGRKNISDVGSLQVKLTFDTVLNIIDGVNSCDGVLTIITTNYMDKLDDAILRAGRMDRKVKVEVLNANGKEFIAKKILNGYTELYTDVLSNTNDTESNAEFENKCIQIALEKFWKES